MRTTRKRGGEAAPPARLLDDDPVAVLRAASGVDCPVLHTVLERARTEAGPALAATNTPCALPSRAAVCAGGLRRNVRGTGGHRPRRCLRPHLWRVRRRAQGCATATRQAAFSATHYEDAVRRRVINPVRSVRGQPVVDYDLLLTRPPRVIAFASPMSRRFAICGFSPGAWHESWGADCDACGGGEAVLGRWVGCCRGGARSVGRCGV